MFFCIYKPRGISSHTAVHRLKKKLGYSRVGHAGTLDQEAEGLLIIAVEGATPLLGELLGRDKTYEYTIDLSRHSPSHDLSTETRAYEHPVYPTRDQLERILQEHFLGDIEQVPPVYSAIWVDGKRSYDLVLQGKSVELKKRKVHISSHTIISYEAPILRGQIRVSSGTYIRSIARDLASILSTGGILTHLLRTSIGDITLEQGVHLDAVKISDQIKVDTILSIDRKKVIPEEYIAYIKNGDFRFYRDAKPGRELLINQDNETLSLIEIDHNQSIKVLAQLYPRAGKRGIIGKI